MDEGDYGPIPSPPASVAVAVAVVVAQALVPLALTWALGGVLLSAWLLYVHCNSRSWTAEQVVRLPR